METIRPGMSTQDILTSLKKARGYFITNTARDLSQSDYKNRILLHTDLLAAPARDAAGYFSLEITGGASVHVDMLRKQVDPFLKLELLRREMPNTLFQTLCRGVNLFGYRPYPENAIRVTVKEFAKYVEVWRVFDFLNHVPNMVPVFEEVKKSGRLLQPSICFSTGPEHTDEFYVTKVQEILDVTGEEIILCIKNHGGLGTPKRMGALVTAIKQKFPDLLIHYHGHNTDGNDVARITAAILAGAKIVDAADHAFTAFYGPPPVLSVIQTMESHGIKAEGVSADAVIQTSEVLRPERAAYSDFEAQFRGFDPTVQIHKLPGGATGSSFEQAVKGGFLHLMPRILHEELPRVQIELGNWWSVTPGSQILWTTAVNNVLTGGRYDNVSGDLKNLLLGRYGPFPFYKPSQEIYAKVFGPEWKKTLKAQGGVEKISDIDIDKEEITLVERIGRAVSTEELVLYLQHPNDAVDFFKFEQTYGKTYMLSPQIWFRKGGFRVGEHLDFVDYTGKSHVVEIGPMYRSEKGKKTLYLFVDHHPEVFLLEEEKKAGVAEAPKLSKEEIAALAKVGDIRAPFTGNVCQIPAKAGQEVKKGQIVIVLEAMKMQNPIESQLDGKIDQVFVKLGQATQAGDKLLTIAPL